MSSRPNARRQAVLLGVVLILGGVAAWRLLGTGAAGPEEASVSKAQDLAERFEATGLATEPPEDDAGEVSEAPERGPQSPDD
ncbi:MAG: hypothetical protein ACIARR_05670 [Phycisphaerales bacterium JB059]